MAIKIKDRKVGGEAPSVRVKMMNGEEKIVGMIATKIQVFLTLNDINSYTKELHEVLNTNPEKAFGYIVTASSDEETQKVVDAYTLDTSLITIHSDDFSKKFGLNAVEGKMANSVFIIDKEGIIYYKEIAPDIDVATFGEKLVELINYKPKGHVHENWMRA